MLVKALKSFAGRYGHIRAGITFECEPHYFEALRRHRLVDAAPADATPDPGAPGPQKNRNVPKAPLTPGKDGPGNQGGEPGKQSAPSQDDGTAPPSVSLRADLRSRQKTSRKSAVGVTSSSIRRASRNDSEQPKEASDKVDM